MIETNSDVNLALSKALEESNAQFLKQRDFTVAVDTLQKQLLQDLEASSAEAQSLFEKFMKHMDAALQTLFSQFSLAARKTETALAGLNKVR